MSQPVLNPSFRFPGIVLDPSVPKAVSDVIRLHANALTDIYQAIPALKSQIDNLTQGQSTTTVIESSSGGGGGGGGGNISGLGSVHNLQGETTYTNQPSDNGALLIFGDASPVAVQLSSGISSPYLLFAQNWGAGVVTFTPSSGAISFIGNPGAASMTLDEGYSALLIFDGTNWWAETLPIEPQNFSAISHQFLNAYDATTGLFSSEAVPLSTDSTPGIVQPDNVTIGIDSGLIYTFITAASGAPSSTPDTPGNPFYFDSSLSPWQGYVWLANSWHPFA